mgnify:CR=1 FL=1
MTLKARITNQYDSARLIAGGGAREVTIVSCVVETDDPTPRAFGPFEKVFDRTVDQYTIDAWLEERRRALEGRV